MGKLKVLNQIKSYIRKKITDAYIISYPKCGRTWLQMILMHYVLRHYRKISDPLPFEWGPSLIRHTWYLNFPNIYFTHDIANRPIPYEDYNDYFDASIYLKKQAIILIRDPRDVVVSYYHHAKKKTAKNRLPANISLSAFIRHKNYGIKAVVAYYNMWAPIIQTNRQVSWLRYEDLRADPITSLELLLKFCGVPSIDHESLAWAIDCNSFGNLQAREIEKKQDSDNAVNKNTLRVRQGKVGGYREEMQQEDIEYVHTVLHKHLNSFYDYE